MSETEHIKNLLIKGMQEKKECNPIEDLYVEPRLGIKGASIQIIDSFIDVIAGFLEEDPVQELNVRFFLYTDGSETVFIVNDNSVIDLPAHPVGDFFDEVVEDLNRVIIENSFSIGVINFHCDVSNFQSGISDVIFKI